MSLTANTTTAGLVTTGTTGPLTTNTAATALAAAGIRLNCSTCHIHILGRLNFLISKQFLEWYLC